MDVRYATRRERISPVLLFLVYVYFSVDKGARRVGAALGLLAIICLSDSSCSFLKEKLFRLEK